MLFSACAALSLLARLDGATVIGPMLGVVLFRVTTCRLRHRHKIGAWVAVLGPLAALVGAWLIWKQVYYGAVVPNTFYAKASHGPVWSRGLRYLWLYHVQYALLPFLVGALVLARRCWRQAPYPFVLIMGAIGTQHLYVASVGGDFMEFRFMVPVTPLLVVLVIGLVLRALRSPGIQVAMIAGLLAASFWHSRAFAGVSGLTEPIPLLHSHLRDPGYDWVGVGSMLGEAFEGEDVVIAVSAAGAVPYFSRLPSVDQFGLSDPSIARHGIDVDLSPGHVRVAPLDYLVRRRVNPALGTPRIVPRLPRRHFNPGVSDLGLFHPFIQAAADDLPGDAVLLEIPMDAKRSLVALYLIPHEAVQRAIEERGWRRLPIAREALRARSHGWSPSRPGKLSSVLGR